MSTKTALVAKSITEIKVKPTLVKKLRAQLTAYLDLDTQIKELTAARDAIKEAVGALREQTGEQSITLDGYTVTRVEGTYKKFDPKTLMRIADVSAAQIEEATLERPKKGYEKITVPGQRAGSDDE